MKTHDRLMHGFLVLLLLAGCEKVPSYGMPHEVVVAVSPTLQEMIQDSVVELLSPIRPPLRREGTLQVLFEDPYSQEWALRRLARSEILIGTENDPFIVQALRKGKRAQERAIPALVERKDLWARNQDVRVLLVNPEENLFDQITPILADLRQQLHRRFRDGVLERMFVSGKNTVLQDSLLDTAGFGLLLPNVYRHTRGDSVHVFRNDNPNPRKLIRQFAVTWRPLIPAETVQLGSLLAWRQKLSESFYSFPQETEPETISVRGGAFGKANGVEVLGSWTNPRGSLWPAGGPFILRAITCPAQDRLYLIDAWLYAPEREKGEYLIQLQTVLESFHCGEEDRFE